MSNKTQLQTNNTKYASLIETLRGKAVGGSTEDVTDETNAYTEKIAQLTTAVTALETELAGKASGGGSGGGSVETCTVTLTPKYTQLYNIVYTTANSSGALAVEQIYKAEQAITLENVVVGSAITCAVATAFVSVDITGEASIIYQGFGNYGAFSPLAISAANANVSIMDDA